jgi:hypothetical protein
MISAWHVTIILGFFRHIDLLIAFGLTLLVLAVGSVLIWAFASGVKGGDIHGHGDAVFFTAGCLPRARHPIGTIRNSLFHRSRDESGDQLLVQVCVPGRHHGGGESAGGLLTALSRVDPAGRLDQRRETVR